MSENSGSFDSAKTLLNIIHKHKTEAEFSIACHINSMKIAVHPSTLNKVQSASQDISMAVRAEHLEFLGDNSIPEEDYNILAVDFDKKE